MTTIPPHPPLEKGGWRGLIIVVLMAFLAIPACKKGPVTPQPAVPSPQASAAQAPTAPVQAAAPLEGTPVVLEYRYDPVGKPDPFEPFDFSKIGVLIPTSPLQQFELSQLKLVGIIWGIPDARALVEDPVGKGYVVQRGTKIGKNDGTVIRILSDEVVVLEKYQDFFTGKIKTNEVSMKLIKTGGLTP